MGSETNPPEGSLIRIAAKWPSEEDWKILDNYQSFGAELARIALLEIAAILWVLFDDNYVAAKSWLQMNAPWPLASALMILALSTLMSLLHRYLSADSMAEMVLLGRRRDYGSDDSAARDRMHSKLKFSGYLLLASSLFLVLGTILVISIVISYVG